MDSKSDIKRKYKLIIEEEYISESDSPHDIEKICMYKCILFDQVTKVT